jgi:hypothetical protein
MTHPITPPAELVQQWSVASPIQSNDENWAYELFIAHRAAQWGADRELDACCEWLSDDALCHSSTHGRLRTARRPKPPSLKEQALDELVAAERLYPADWSTIRRALEALPE